MDQVILERAQRLVKNRDVVKKSFVLGDGLTYLSGASIFTMHDQDATTQGIKAVRASIKKKVNVFSEIRGEAIIPLTCIAAVQDDPDAFIDKALAAYKSLRSKFFPSPYLPLAAFAMAQDMALEDFAPLADKAKKIYMMMKNGHYFLTGQEDSPMCLMLAMSDKEPEAMMKEVEACFQILKPEFFSKDSVQSLSQVLALSEGAPEEKCAKTMELFHKLRAAQMKYGTHYELATLGILALSGEDFDTLISEMGEVDKWLSKQKGFGKLSTVSAKQRMMFSGMLVQLSSAQATTMQAMALSSTITIMVQQEIIMYSIMASSMYSAMIASGSH